jgi:hypothetical protein
MAEGKYLIMSIHAMVHYLEHKELKGNEKLTMVILANYADEDGECYPGVERIANQLNMSKRGAQKLLSKLHTDGHLEIKHNAGISTGTGKTNRYKLTSFARKETIHPQQGVNHCSPLHSRKGVNSGAQGVNSGAQGVNSGSPDPSVDPSVDPKDKECNNLSPLPASADPMLSAATSKFNNKQTSRGARGSWQAEMNLRVPARIRVPLVNCVGRICGLTAMMDADEGTLIEVHDMACWLHEQGYDSSKVDELYKIYLSDEWLRANHPRPSVKALMRFASKQAENGTTPILTPKAVGIYMGPVENLA